jgi:triphosphoribosyl-dephospho-CoA synthase
MLSNPSLPLGSEFHPIIHADKFSTSESLRLADFAVAALIEEAMPTPKPALVDTRGSGAHRDLDLRKLIGSAHALHGAFFEMAMRRGADAARYRRQQRPSRCDLGTRLVDCRLR